MGKVAITGTKNTIYVTTPDTITVTPSNINSFLSSSFTPKITTKNAPASTHTKFFVFELQRQGLNYRDLIIYSAKFTEGSKTATNITAYTGTYGCGSSVKLGRIAQDKISGKTYNLIRVTEHETIGDVGEMSSGYAAVTINFNSFNPTVTISKSSTSTINSQFGLVKGFFKSTFNATALSSWSYTGGTIAPNTTLKTTAAGVEGNTSTGTGSRSSSVTTGIISGTSVTGTAVAGNGLGGSVTKTATVTAQDYSNPQLSNIKVDRNGTNAVVTLNWSVAQVNKSSNVTSSITVGRVKVDWTATANTTGAPTWSGTEVIAADGSAMSAVTGTLPITDSTHTYENETSYTFTITLTDRLGQSTTVTVVLPTKFYTIDFKAGGRGVAFGRAATMDNAVVFDAIKMRPKVLNGTLDTNTFYEATREDNPNSSIHFGIGSGGVNRGIWVNNIKGAVDAADDSGGWLIYADGNGIIHTFADYEGSIASSITNSWGTSTVSGASITAAYATRRGNVVQLLLSVKNNNAVAGGSNWFEGTVAAAWRPKNSTVFGASYYGTRATVASLGPNGHLTIRNASTSAISAKSSSETSDHVISVSITYIVD